MILDNASCVIALSPQPGYWDSKERVLLLGFRTDAL